MTKVYTSFNSCHRNVLEKLLYSDGIMRLDIVVSPNATDRVPFSVVGYSSNRWIKYTDAYLYGGPAFRAFLAEKIPNNSVSTFTFGGTIAHSRGPCVLTLSVSKNLVHLNCRVLHWANAAVLDLSLVWLLIKRYRKPVWITAPQAKVLDWQLAGYMHLSNLPRTSLVKNALAMRKNPELLTWDRQRKKAERTFDHSNTDEETMIEDFVRITPEDLAIHCKIKGTKLRDVLRAEFGYSTKGESRQSHSWASYDDPRCRRVCEVMGINIKKLPSIEQLVAERLKRHAT